MKVLITGGSGLLGKSLVETKPDNTETIQTWHRNINGAVSSGLDTWYKLDIRNRDDIDETFYIIKPDIVIHCAAIGSVDYTEDHYNEVAIVNYYGTQDIVNIANEHNTKLVYISTNAVYSGNLPPYNEKSPLEPINAYGQIKQQAEQYIRDTAKNWLIIRPFLLYGWPYPGGRTNWAVKIVSTLRNGGSLKLVDDHIWMPTYAPNCARAIWKLLNQDNEIYNIASPERATLYEFGLKVCEVFGMEKNLIRPVGSDYFLSIAKRPKDTTYDLIKLSQQGIMLSDIKTGLERMKEAENEL